MTLREFLMRIKKETDKHPDSLGLEIILSDSRSGAMDGVDFTIHRRNLSESELDKELLECFLPAGYDKDYLVFVYP